MVLVLGYSYLFGVLELIFKNGVFYDFLGKSFTFVPVITALVLNKKVEKNTGGRMSLKVWKNPKALAASAFAPGILIAMGAVLYFLVFPNEYSGVFAMGNLFEGRENTAISNPFMFVLICILISAVFFPIHLLELGEEVGWRGYLLWKQKDIYGEPKAVIINGIEWGIAHLPLIYFGFNYSLDNPGAPWTNMLLMMLSCVVIGILFSYVTLKTGNCMYAAIMHGATNIIDELPVYCSKSQQSGLLGPNPGGLLAMSFLFIAAAVLFILMLRTKHRQRRTKISH